MNIKFSPFIFLLMFFSFVCLFLLSIYFCLKWKKFYSINAYILKIGYYGYDLFFISIICLIIASLIWLHISYRSYYHGLESRTKRYNEEYLEAAKKLFNNENDSLQECKDKFKFLTSTSLSGIAIIDQNNKKEILKNLKFIGDASDSTISNRFYRIKTSKGVFKLVFSFSVKPTRTIGLIRAFTCSISDVFGTGDEKYYGKLTFAGKCKEWWSGYYNYGNWRRSENLYVPLYALLVIICGIKGLYNEVKSVNEKLEEFKTIHQKMYSDLLNENNQIKQPIQEYNFSWDTYIDTIFQNERHDLKNKFPSLVDEQNFTELEKQISDKFKNEYLDKLEEVILAKMRDLPNIVKYELQETSVEKTLEAIKKRGEAIPSGFIDGKAGVNFYPPNTESISINEGEFCKVNIHRLASIIFNILTNANKACIRRKNDARRNKIKYDRRIWMNIERIIKGSNDYISVSINDNAGGFPENIINKIYKEPVISSDEINGQKRMGEGTVYVGFFAKYMKMKITVENCTAEDNNTGAKVNLLIPILKR